MSVFASVLRCLLGCGRWSLRAAEVLRNPRERAALKIYLAFLARRYFRNLKRDLPSTFMEVRWVVVAGVHGELGLREANQSCHTAL